MAMAEQGDRSVSIGRIFSRAFGVMGANPGVVFGVALVIGAVPQILYGMFVGANLAMSQPFSPAAILGSMIVFLISMVSRSLVTGCITRATVAYSQGQRVSLGDCLRVAFARILPVIGVSLLLGIAVVLGFVLLIVPGVILAVMWSVAVPVTIEERTGVFGAFARSRELTSGARWKIFGLFLLILLIGLGIGLLAVLLSTAATGVSYMNPLVMMSAGAIAVNVIVSTISAAIWSTLQTSLFVELREWKDGPLDAKLSDIFA
jgi:hypothetical protein